MDKNVIAIIDGAAGSCGKAKVVGELATNINLKINASITNCMPNAGHTFVDEKGNATVFRNIPVAAVNPETELFIAPGSAIDMDVFIDEYRRVEKYLGNRKIYVHELVPLITNEHKEYEKSNIKSGSTNKGCGAVSKDKILRKPNLNFFKGYKNAVVCSNEEFNDRLFKHLDNKNGYVILEGSQGCDLDLNHSGNYPFVTSRNVSTTQLLADSGIPADRLLETIMVIRPFPIRISNVTKEGSYIYTGDYGTGNPLYWTQINIGSKLDTYPTHKIIDDYYGKIILPSSKIIDLLNKSTKVSLMQLFGKNYESININDITSLQLLELERLIFKNAGVSNYHSNIIDDDIEDLSEQTTVTKMERRIFDLDINKLKSNVRTNSPYCLYLNFFQHLSLEARNCKGNYTDYHFNRYIREYINYIEEMTKTPISSLGTGAKNNEKIKIMELIKK